MIMIVDQTVTWDIDFYPRGVKYNRAKGINITSLTAPIEIPEKIMKTIRLRVTCKSDLDSEQKFKVSIGLFCFMFLIFLWSIDCKLLKSISISLCK